MRLLKTTLLILLFLSFALGQTEQGAAIDSSSAKSGQKALLYSFLPGAGQLYNEKKVKALLFSGTFIYFYVEYLSAQKDYDEDPTDGSLHRTRNDKVWLMGLTWTLNLIDAYVDAQLWDFDKYDIEEKDLPDQEIIKPEETDIPNDDE